MNNSLISKIYFPKYFLFKNYSLVKVIYLLIRCYKTRFFLWNTNNTDRNGVNKENTYTKHSEKDNTGKCYLVWISVIPYHFKIISPTPPFFGKNLNPHFFQKFWKLKAPSSPFIKGGGSTMKQRFFSNQP